MYGRLTRTVLLLASLIPVACPAASDGAEVTVRFDRQCAQKDLAVMVLIEHHGMIGELTPDELAMAWQTLLDARTACSEERVGEAIALYQSVLDLGPPRAFLRQITERPEGAQRSRK
jgi:hypothetical protein